LCNKDYRDFGKFEEHSYEQSVKYEAFFVLALIKKHLDMYTYKVGTQHIRRWLTSFDITIHKR